MAQEFLIYSVWAAKRENVLSDMCAQRRLLSACASVQANQRLVVRRKKLFILGYPKCTQWRFWSDCANSQADRIFPWAHICEGTFSEVAASFKYSITCHPPIHGYSKQKQANFDKSMTVLLISTALVQITFEPFALIQYSVFIIIIIIIIIIILCVSLWCLTDEVDDSYAGRTCICNLKQHQN